MICFMNWFILACKPDNQIDQCFLVMFKLLKLAKSHVTNYLDFTNITQHSNDIHSLIVFSYSHTVS